jgi:hypothetical protein
LNAKAMIRRLDGQTVVVERRGATVVDPQTGVSTEGALVLGTLVCSVQARTHRRVDETAGTSTTGEVNIFAAENVVLPEDVDGGPLRASSGKNGDSDQPADYIRWAAGDGPLRRWRVSGHQPWPAGRFTAYTATDEGALES